LKLPDPLIKASGARKVAIVIAIGVVATIAAVVLIGQAARVGTVVHKLRDASPGWLVLCAAGELVAYAGYVICYQAVARLDNGPRLPYFVALRVVSLAFGAFSVATVIGGLSVDFWALREAGEPTVRASARIIAMETLRWAILGTASCAVAISVLAGVWHHPSGTVAITWLGVVTFSFAGAMFVTGRSRRDRYMQRVGGSIRRGFAVAVRALVLLGTLRRDRLRWRALAGGATFWLGDLVCAWAALRAFGLAIAPGPLLLGYVTGSVATGLPLPAGGAGSVDAAMTGGFVLAGAPLSTALLGAVAFRVFNFWLPAFTALGSAATLGGLRRRLHEIAASRSGPSDVR
jgi:hypothetical protein